MKPISYGDYILGLSIEDFGTAAAVLILVFIGLCACALWYFGNAVHTVWIDVLATSGFISFLAAWGAIHYLYRCKCRSD